MSPKFHIGCGKKQKKKTKKTHCKYFIMTHLKYSQWVPIPVGNLMFKVNNRNSRTRCEIRSAGFELAVRNSQFAIALWRFASALSHFFWKLQMVNNVLQISLCILYKIGSSKTQLTCVFVLQLKAHNFVFYMLTSERTLRC